MRNFLVFNISAEPFNPDLLSGFLWEFDILGINEFDTYLSVSVEENSGVSLKLIKQYLEKIKEQNFIESFSITQEFLESKNWNEEWEKTANVIEVSDKFIIKPSFKTYKIPEGKVCLIIDPKMSFGTGEHQTTRIMLELLDKYIKVEDKVLDVGTGTGILGIAASKLGASSVIAVDNDEWCYQNATENLKLNDIMNMRINLGTLTAINEKDFNLVLSNINRNVLLELKRSLFELIKFQGTLIISGILESDLAEINRQFTQIGFTAVEIKQKDEWYGIVYRKC